MRAEIRTERLKLCVLTPADVEIAAKYYRENRSHHAPWEPLRDDDFFSSAQCLERLENSCLEQAAGRALQLALIEPSSGAMIGACNFTQIVRGPFQACSLGYSIAAGHEGKGLMFEALSATTLHVFEALGLHRIMANHLLHNRRSEKLLRRLGFEKEGYAKSYLMIAGKWQDHVLNALLNPRRQAE